MMSFFLLAGLLIQFIDGVQSDNSEIRSAVIRSNGDSRGNVEITSDGQTEEIRSAVIRSHGDSRGNVEITSDGQTEDSASTLLSTISSGLPADIDAWEKKMEARMQQESNQSDFLAAQDGSNKIRMVLGIPSCPGDERIRDVIRRTWAKRPGACLMNLDVCSAGVTPWNGITPLNSEEPFLVDNLCTATVVFFVGNGATASLDRDILTLKVPDGKICYGQNKDKKDERNFHSLTKKVYEFFTYANAHLTRWATHIARVDEDYFPALHHIIPQMAKLDNAGASRQYIGRMMSSHHCNNRMVDVEHNPKRESESFCVYGQFFALSSPLLQDLMSQSGRQYWGDVIDHPDLEDRDIGRTISRFARQPGVHITTFTAEQERIAFPDIIG